MVCAEGHQIRSGEELKGFFDLLGIFRPENIPGEKTLHASNDPRLAWYVPSTKSTRQGFAFSPLIGSG